MISNTVRSAVSILTDQGYEFQENMYDRLHDLELEWDGERFLTAQILADEYHRRYKDDLKHAVFVLKTSRSEKK